MSSLHPSRARDLVELIFGYSMIVGIIWTPERLQRVLSPVALVLTLLVVLAHRHNRDELGLGARDFVRSLWILPAAAGLAALSIFAAAKIGALHALYKADFAQSPATCFGPSTSSFFCRTISWTACCALSPAKPPL